MDLRHKEMRLANKSSNKGLCLIVPEKENGFKR